MPGGEGRPARQGLQHALGGVDGGRRVPRAVARRHLHVPARRQEQGRKAAPDVRGQPDGVHRRAGGRRGDRRPHADPRPQAQGPAPALRGGARLEERSRARSGVLQIEGPLRGYKWKGPLAGPFPVLLPKPYFRCLLTSLVISNIDTWLLPLNTVFSLSSALIMRRFFLS